MCSLTCGSDLPLHPVQSHQKEVYGHIYSPFAGVPIKNGPLPVGAVDPWLLPHKQTPGKPWGDFQIRSPFGGVPIKNGPLPVGAVDPWLLPHDQKPAPGPEIARPLRSPFAGAQTLTHSHKHTHTHTHTHMHTYVCLYIQPSAMHTL